MSGFSTSWLALREPWDHAARADALTTAVVEHLQRREIGPRAPLRVLDLGTGTGSNARYLIGRLPSPQAWTMVDADESLLDALPIRMAAWASRNGRACVHLRDGIEISSHDHRARCRPCLAQLASLPIPAFADRPSLVTASALLDLVSEPWLVALASSCAGAGAAVLFALDYDGRVTISPSHPDDDMVLAMVNRHQRIDKGFGPAAGPEATAIASRCFAAVGYEVRSAASDWVLTPEAAPLQRALLGGWAAAARELQPDTSPLIGAWEDAHLQAVERGALTIVVGHQDFVGWSR